ncbi:patatin-like phospholipase family protein [Nitratireductor sp. XY-223]|uniref:patatin-like phospholipase family protein n=1 Tax=Nitratireductor sp. XY-223 TaxID=2561926 RepID=UPI0010AAFA46|nr:patatin-like phospholipase family protein [Nitratireductor sp. XY-223]
MSDEPVFTLGLTMAGAVSAGAYSAGVFDFLVQALEEWEKARASDAALPENERRVPNHRILIPVISGASAGGATAALGTFALAAPTRLPTPQEAPGTRCVVPALFETWVESVSFTAGREGTLLGTSDLQDGGRVASLLDGSVLRNTAERIIGKTETGAAPRPYLAENLHIFMTVTNLRGVPYGIRFTASDKADTAAHVMALHADRVHYRFSKVGSGKFESAWLREYGDSGTPMDADMLKASYGEKPDGADKGRPHQFVESALATAAFPIGLPAQQINSHTSDYDDRAWPYASKEGIGSIRPVWPKNNAGERSYDVHYAGVDGGVINNEPFEIARWTIKKKPLHKRNEPDAVLADRAVLLVDPFPQSTEFIPDLSDDERLAQICLKAVVTSLFPTLKNQARVKAIDLARSGNDKLVFSRFLIAPSRQIGQGDDERAAADPLATGVLGAFGGFLSSRFPEHDYQLGRRNCQHFLRRHFRVAAGNDITKSWPAGCDPKYTIKDKGGTAYRVLVPLFASADIEVTRPQWPRVGDAEIDEFIDAVKRRSNALVKAIAATEFDNWYLPWIARVAWRIKRGAVLRWIRKTLTADLVRRDQHERYAGLSGDLEHNVLACLFDLDADECTPLGIADAVNKRNGAKTHARRTDEREVRKVLDGGLVDYVESERNSKYALRPPYRPSDTDTVLGRISGFFGRR